MKLYNTLTRQRDELTPLDDKKIRLYNCGLTVYSQPQIGNWTAYIYWDILARTLRLSGYDVSRVQNITDVGHLTSDEDRGEDKLEKGARREGLTAWDVAAKYIAIADHEAYDLLDLIRPDHMPRATDYIPQQIAFVVELEKRGYTYEIPDDGIYFDTSKLENYGQLARLDIEGLRAGARVEDIGKKTPTDFAIWKFSPAGHKRDMQWDSPWGVGFPGWHLECSVMARELLGDQIDIHTGGIDHIPVHHSNEIAQTETITGKPFAQVWLHNNFLKIEGVKISKSLGNTYALQDIIDRGYSLDAFKLLVLSKHYRTEGNFTWEILDAAQQRLKHLQAWADLRLQPLRPQPTSYDYVAARERILGLLTDDLSTPETLVLLNQIADEMNEGIHQDEGVAFSELLQFIDEALGMHFLLSLDISMDQHNLITQREQARNDKDWTHSDQLRDRLTEQGIGLRDTPHGTLWYRL